MSADEDLAENITRRYVTERHKIKMLLDQMVSVVRESPSLEPYVHFLKARMKDPGHLRKKILKKICDAREDGETFDITPENLFEKINDLAGIRIIHLHTDEFPKLHVALKEALIEARLEVRESFARVWDIEMEKIYTDAGLRTEDSDKMYTSVHYVVSSNSKTLVTGEVQVRTLAEELWGEVDHKVNYPVPSGSHVCREQIRVLARLVSASARLVDSIFKAHTDYEASLQPHLSAPRPPLDGTILGYWYKTIDEIPKAKPSTDPTGGILPNGDLANGARCLDLVDVDGEWKPVSESGVYTYAHAIALMGSETQFFVSAEPWGTAYKVNLSGSMLTRDEIRTEFGESAAALARPDRKSPVLDVVRLG